MINSQQIGNIKTFNTLMGGLATNTSSLLMGGNANFNILNLTDFGTRINGGLLELTVGKDGISSKIGNGGTNISYSNIKSSISGASSLHKNSQINNTKYDKQTKDALRSQWGFGDKTAKKQLEEIIKGDTILKLDADGSEVAQSINENGKKIIHINSSQNEGFIDLGLILQHEAHRDGIVSDAQSQFIETANAVAGHTQMALAMAIDKLYTKDMLNHITSDSNLQNDINAYMYAAYTGNTGLFAGYVNAAYDSSADYWKLMDDGSLAYDGKTNLYDENGNLIYKTDSQGIQGSLKEILGLENQIEAYNLMIQAGMEWDGKSWKNSSNPTDGSLAIKMDMTTGENGTGRTYKELYETRELTDSLTGYTATLEQHNPQNIYQNMVANGTMDIKDEYKGTWGNIKSYFVGDSKYISYEDFKDNNYITGDMPTEGIDYQVGLPIEVIGNNNALITSTFLASGNLGIHYGIDMSIAFSKNIYPLLFSDSTESKNFGNPSDLDSAGGYHVDLNSSFNYIYKGQGYTDTIKQRYMHLDSITVNDKTTVSSSMLLGIGGNTGTKTTAAHLHLDISTSKQSPWLSYLSKKNNMAYTSGYQFRYWYNPDLFLNNSYQWRYTDADKYNK